MVPRPLERTATGVAGVDSVLHGGLPAPARRELERLLQACREAGGP